MTTDVPAASRHDFRAWRSITTRWMDDDSYGHVNNAVHYSYFDTAVNGFLMEATGVDIRTLPAIGIVAETSCRYMKSLSFPERIEVGLAVERIGRSSIVYRIGIFREGDAEPAAIGRFVHVYVDQKGRRPTPVPQVIRAAVAPLVRA